MSFESFSGNAAKKKPPIPRPKGEQAPIELSEADMIEISKVRTKPPLPPRLRRMDVVPTIESIEPMEIQEPGEHQTHDIEPPFEVSGFKGIQVVATLEKKDERKGNPQDRNEDNVLLDPDTGLIGVLDGLGGGGKAGSGSKASMSAETAIPEAYKGALEEMKKQTPESVAGRIVEHQLARLNIDDPALRLAKQKELASAFEQVIATDPNLGRRAAALLESIRRANDTIKQSGGKTTACLGFVHRTPEGKSYAVVANIGDSMAFKRRANGEMIPLTDEDSLLNSMTSSGSISPEQLATMKQDPEKIFRFPISLELVQALGYDKKMFEEMQAEGKTELPIYYKFLKRSMVRSMGGETAEASLSIRELKQGDELLFATDIFDNFEQTNAAEMDVTRIAQVAGNAGSQTERLARLREAAMNGPKKDDAALVSARVL